ncbi:MAG: serine hydrolase domain-containing protein [Bacteroidota bacterium]
MKRIHDKLQHLIAKEVRTRHTRSVLLGVQTGDRTVDFRGAAGEVSPDSPYFVASIAKMFTATVVMQLVDEGTLNLDEPIQTYLSHLPLDGIHVYKGVDYSQHLRVYHLLHQTSGLPDCFAGGLVEDFKRNQDRSYSVEDVLEMARNAAPFAAPDSGKSHYSDTNYQLLGALLEAITEQPLAEGFQARIFGPLGMADSYLFDSSKPRPVEPLPAYYNDTRLSLPLAITSERGTGGAVSTVSDTLRFLRGFFGGQLFEKAHFERMMQWTPMFFPMQYGYGIWRYQLPRWATLFRASPEFIGHAGVWGAMAFYSPEHDLYIAGTLNQLDKPARQFQLMPRIVSALT